MKKIILFLMVLSVCAFSQQSNYTHGVDAVGNALTGSFTALDTTGATDYTIVIPLDDIYPFDYSPLVLDSVTVIDGSNALNIGTLWFQFDVFVATDSCSFDIDAYTGVYGDANRTVAGIKWDATPVEIHSSAAQVGDVTTGVRIYTESSAGKLMAPHVIKLVLDLDTINNTDDITGEVGSNAFYYEVVYPAIYQIHKERR